MEKVLSSFRMKQADAYTIEQIGLPSLVLMERAAMAVARRVRRFASPGCRILAVCGSGNNGGDGFAAARLLLGEFPGTEVFFAGDPARMTRECAAQRQIYLAMGGRIVDDPCFDAYELFIDAIFGVGLSRTVTKDTAKIIDRMNDSRGQIVSVDLPSGVSADDGSVLGTAVRADHTVTFQFLKRGHILYPGAQLCGSVECAPVGILLPPGEEEDAFTFSPEDARALLPPRSRRSNKGMYGHALIIAGRANMAGCAVLCTRSAARMGTGLVMTVSDRENREILQLSAPEALYRPACGELSADLWRWASAVAIGPGIGTEDDAYRKVKACLTATDQTLILDADALNTIAADESGTLMGLLKGAAGRTILTPHPGEMGRLCGERPSRILGDPVFFAGALARRTGAVVALKDAATVVTDGKRLYLNRSGCDGMAAGGSGDVLTGMLCGLAAQGMEPFDAACLGVYLHGLAGEAAQGKLGPRGMQASDIIDAIPGIIYP